jgi:predicted HTH domain antitoxin
MRTLEIHYNDSLPFALGESPAAFEKEAVFLLALKLFELGRLSAGKAAEFCGLSKPEFLWRATQSGVPSVRLDDDQLETEFSNA